MRQSYEDPFFRIEILEDGVILAMPSGFWDAIIAKRYIERMGERIASARLSHGMARVVSDNSGVKIHPQEVADLLAQHLVDQFVPGDRLGFVTASMLNKIQIGRNARGTSIKFFTSQPEAIEWVRERNRPDHEETNRHGGKTLRLDTALD